MTEDKAAKGLGQEWVMVSDNLPWYMSLCNHDYRQSGNRIEQEWVMVSDNLLWCGSLGNHDYRQSGNRIGVGMGHGK